MTASGPEIMTARLQRFGLARDQMRSALASGAGISQTDLDALEHLEAAGPLTQRELGTRLALTSGAITMLVDRLERAGLVRRRPHPSDRRSVLLELAPEAAARIPAALDDYHAAIAGLVADVPPADRAAVTAFLEAAAAAAADAVAAMGR